MGPLTLRRILRSRTKPKSWSAVLTAHRVAGNRAEAAVRIFYCFPLFWLATHLSELTPLLRPAEPSLLWPVAWVRWTDLAPPIILGFGFVSATLGAWRPEERWIRLCVFIGLLEVLALKFSFGKIHHLMHAWLFCTFVFVWLPNDWHRAHGPGRARVRRQSLLFVFSGAQVAVAMTYSLAGLGKILGTAYQAVLGQVTPLHPSALARHIADRILQTHADSLLGAWMIEHAAFLWPMMIGTLYLQTFALFAALRPRLHRVWGVGLMVFHTVTLLALTIDFTPSIFLVGLLFVASPVAPNRFDLFGFLRDLPIIGFGIEALRQAAISPVGEPRAPPACTETRSRKPPVRSRCE
ncbi:MAG: hypothetical protein ACFB9M_16955 [Myxococcota bacterium]